MQVDRSAQPTATHSIMRVNREDEHALVGDALQKLWMPVPSSADAKRAAEAGNIAVPVGTQVNRAGSNEPETVIGARDRFLFTARTNPATGAVEHTVAPFESFAQYSPSLLQSPATVDGWTGAQLAELRRGVHTPKGFADQLWAPTWHSMEDVAAHGDDATVSLRNVDAPKGTAATEVQVPWGYWRNQVRQASALTPVAVPPASAFDAANLRLLTGDRHMVISAAGQHNLIPAFDKPADQQPRAAARDRLIGTESAPGRRGGPTLDRVDDIEQFFHDKIGNSVMGKSRQVVATTDIPENLVNASAGLLDAQTAQLNEGTQSARVNEQWLRQVPSSMRRDFRHVNELLRNFSSAVFAHEGDHVDQFDQWGDLAGRLGDDVVQTPGGAAVALEEGVTQEAYSDVAGYARTGKPSVGVRELGRSEKYFATLPQFRRTNAILPEAYRDSHHGTQLVTKPMVAFGEARGMDALAEVLGAATRNIGTDIRNGRYTVVNIPRAASALHEAAAQRFGADDPTVRSLRQEWSKLGVQVRDLAFDSWGETGPRARAANGFQHALKVAEEDQVRGALSDLDRVSASGRPNSRAIRELTRLRETEQGSRAILTGPIAQLGRQHGWGAVNSITTDARTTLGTQLREGRFDAVGMPDAARALRDATERHFGRFSAPVQHVEQGYSQLWNLEKLTKIVSGLR
jgi:hypothetical protein